MYNLVLSFSKAGILSSRPITSKYLGNSNYLVDAGEDHAEKNKPIN